MNRRDFLFHSGGGLGGIALAALLGTDRLLADAPAKRADGGLHHKPKAKRVVQLFMAGGASHVDLNIIAVYNFICPDENQLAARLQRRALRDNRLDDANLEVIKKRLAIFEKETRPILAYYGPDLVHTIDSTQTPINVLRDILRVLARI